MVGALLVLAAAGMRVGLLDPIGLESSSCGRNEPLKSDFFVLFTSFPDIVCQSRGKYRSTTESGFAGKVGNDNILNYYTDSESNH